MRLYLRSGRGERKFFGGSNYPFVMRRKDTLEVRLAQMRKRQAEVARRARVTPEQREAQRREDYEFNVRIRWYLYASERRMKLERYVTAMYGCKTSWPRIEAHAIYAVVAEGQRP